MEGGHLPFRKNKVYVGPRRFKRIYSEDGIESGRVTCCRGGSFCWTVRRPEDNLQCLAGSAKLAEEGSAEHDAFSGNIRARLSLHSGAEGYSPGEDSPSGSNHQDRRGRSLCFGFGFLRRITMIQTRHSFLAL